MKNKFFYLKKFITLSLLFLMLFVCGCKNKTYTATFKDSDGTILRVYEVPLDEAPVFEGIPEKKSDDLYDYKFYSWDKELTPANEDTTYTAIFITSVKNDSEETVFVDDVELDKLRGDVNNSLLDDNSVSDSYFVTFLDDDNRTILQKTKFKYGTEPYFKSGSPASKIEGDYVYTFTGWDKTFSPVKGEQTYVALYKKEKLNFTKVSQTSTNSSSSNNQSSQNQGNYVSTNTEKELEYFVKLTAYDLSNKQEGGGTFLGAGSYKANSRANIIATPNKGMHFVKWNDGDTSSAKSFVVNGNVEYTAYFEKDNVAAKNTFMVMVMSNNSSGGVVGISPKKSDGMYEEGTSVTISAAPKPGFKFGGWLDNNGVSFGSASDLTKTFKVTQDAIYTALFEKENSVEKEDKKEEDNVTINASISDSSAGYIEINGESTSSLSVKKGTDVTLKANIFKPDKTPFIGWTYDSVSKVCFSNQTSITLNSVSSDVNVTALVDTSGSNPSGPEEDEPTTPEIETVSVSISANPSDACTLKVNDSAEFPSSYKIGQEYKFKFEQTEEQAKKYEFQYWSIGSEKYDNNPIGYNPNKSLTNVIIAVFKEKENGQKTDEEPIVDPQDPLNPDVDTSNIKIGNVVTFNDNNSQEYLVLDSFEDNSKNILKVIPINSTSATKYASSNISTDTISTDISNTKIFQACLDYANNLSDTNLKEHLYPINVNILDYENSNDNYSYNVHQSSISISAKPKTLATKSLSCYPLSLDDFDELYSYGSYKGIYSIEDFIKFLTLTTGNSNNSIWLKDLVSLGSAKTISKGIYANKDGISTASLSKEYIVLPVLSVEVDEELKIDVVTDKSLEKTKIYQINFIVNNSNYGSIEIENNHYNNLFVEDEDINFGFVCSNETLYKFIKWNDGVTDTNRTVKATGNTVYTAIADLALYNFSKDFEMIPFITSTGKQYINTGFVPNENTKIILQCEPIREDSANVGAICGVKNGNKRFDLYISNSKEDSVNKTKYTLYSNAENTTSDQFDSVYSQLIIQPKTLTLVSLAEAENVEKVEVKAPDLLDDFKEYPVDYDTYTDEEKEEYENAKKQYEEEYEKLSEEEKEKKDQESILYVIELKNKVLEEESKDYTIDSENTFSGSNLPLYLFASNNNGVITGLSNIKLYSCQIYDGDTLVRNFIPVKYIDVNDHATHFGLFDTIDSIYYPSSSSKDFEGPKDTDLLFNKFTKLDYLQNNGLSYVDTDTKASNDIGIFTKIMPLSYTNANYIGSTDDNLLISSVLDTSKDEYASLVAKYNRDDEPAVNEYYSTNNTKPLSINSIGYDFLSSKKFYSINNSDSSFTNKIDDQKSISTSTKNIYIGKANGDDYNIGPARYYNVIISDKNNIIHNYYPVKDSEGNYGFLDLVTQEFKDLTNSSFTTPKEITSGLTDISDVKILTRIISDGTQYINTNVEYSTSNKTGYRLSFIPLQFTDTNYMGIYGSHSGSSAITIGAYLSNDTKKRFTGNQYYKNLYADGDQYVLEPGKPKPIIYDISFSEYLKGSIYNSSTNKEHSYYYPDPLFDNAHSNNNTLLFKDKLSKFFKDINESIKNNDKNNDIKKSSIDYIEKFDNFYISIGKVTSNAPGIFYYAAISENQVVKHFYVPAQKGNDIGLYDVVDCKFFKSEEGNFIDGTFKDDTNCQITITSDNNNLNFILKDHLENDLTSIIPNSYSFISPFLSTITCTANIKLDKDNNAYIIDNWDDISSNDSVRNIIFYSPNNITYNAKSKEVKSTSISSIEFLDGLDDKFDNVDDVISLSYYSNTYFHRNVSTSELLSGDSIDVIPTIKESYAQEYKLYNDLCRLELVDDSLNNKCSFYIYPFNPKVTCEFINGETGELLPSDDFSIWYERESFLLNGYSTPDPSIESKKLDDDTQFKKGDVINVTVKPTSTAISSNLYMTEKSTTKLSQSQRVEIDSDYFYKKLTFTYLNYDSFVIHLSFDDTLYEKCGKIRNNSVWKHSSTTDTNSVNEYLENHGEIGAKLSKGDIIRFDDIPDAYTFNYSLFLRNDGKDKRKWNHTSNLYRVIKVDGSKVELMDLTSVDHLMINHDEIDDIEDYDFFEDLDKRSVDSSYKFYLYHYNESGDSFEAGSSEKKYGNNDYWGYVDAYLRVSHYLLYSYYYNMPEKLKSAVVTKNKYLYSYNGKDNYTWKAKPLITSIISNCKVYLLGVKDILDYLEFDQKYEEKKFKDIFSDEQKAKLYDMYGFSNKFMDFSNYRYSYAPINFLIWDYVASGPTIEYPIEEITPTETDEVTPTDEKVYKTSDQGSITKRGTFRLSRDGWLTVSLQNVFDKTYYDNLNNDATNRLNGPSLETSDLKHAIIKSDNNHTDTSYCFIRPCFTIDLNNLGDLTYRKLSEDDLSFLETNYDFSELKYDPDWADPSNK